MKNGIFVLEQRTKAEGVIACARKKSPGQNGKYVSVDDGLPDLRSENFIQLEELVEAGQIRAVIEKTIPLEKMVEAHRYLGTGHMKGNVVITI